jgi:hypothetical protein
MSPQTEQLVKLAMLISCDLSTGWSLDRFAHLQDHSFDVNSECQPDWGTSSGMLWLATQSAADATGAILHEVMLLCTDAGAGVARIRSMAAMVR